MAESPDPVGPAPPGWTDSLFCRLLAQARQGDGQAQERLFAMCRNYVAVLARAKVENWMRAKMDASDLCQQTMVAALRDMHGFRGSTLETWLAWLRAVLHRCALQFVREYGQTEKRQVRRESPLAVEEGSEGGQRREPLAPGDGPSTIVISREDELRLADAIAALPPEHQDVIMLRHVQRLPFDEVARRMGRSRPAAQMLWLRALRKLHQMLQP